MIIRSPLFYVGDKYKLIPQLKNLFPKNINKFIEPFVGGGSVFLNTKAKFYLLNDIDKNVIKIHKMLNNTNENEFFSKIFRKIKHYNLSCSYLGITAPKALKEKYVKTYYAKFNKNSYLNLRSDFNKNQDNMILLYLLLVYGFNHMIRFNKNGDFNLPVGNVDFNKNTFEALKNYLNFIKNKNISFYSCDYLDFFNKIELNKNDFIYFDPPYLISNSEYNKLWDELNETMLYNFIDNLDNEGIKFGITNLLHHKNKTNYIFKNWSKKYKIYNIKSNYISFNDNTIKNDSKELYVTNFKE
ncbi:Dam family site-specific DNA-(adenine-N6)-methyltransferase [Campylobacter sp. FMV-PI01]|uniref:Site-specific DNA-methyltransferase (adenine-specific) n=1 Tax=Campylobacter portucalensis TaxID=2608384 RepID=A0A6L5WFK6_9BACT|nr:Dam family site-specific DNA-(adenine-N6)-methyltransferase [Campylobacter portucalensis]MSN95848.1 Dam family site-specific DNA-(adenine-N6)-methyltransferase [Campylobacter portucalensis]